MRRSGTPTQGQVRIIDVNEDNVSETGFFCYMSKRKSEGYNRKHRWLLSRFSEGMKIKMIAEGGRGFIEYIPGEYAWRPVNARGYMFIHCIWVVGQSKGRGVGKLLLNESIRDARRERMKGVAMATSEGNWLVGREFLHANGFEAVDRAPPSFELMVKRFDDGPPPTFTGDWDRKMRRYGKGLTIIRSDQCPYIEASVEMMVETTRELGIESRTVELKSSQDVRELAPSAYGVFSVIYDGQLLTYHPLGKSDFLERLGKLTK